MTTTEVPILDAKKVRAEWEVAQTELSAAAALLREAQTVYNEKLAQFERVWSDMKRLGLL